MSAGYSRLEKTINAALLWSGHVLGRQYKKRLFSKCRNGRKTSEKTLKKILRSARNSEFGREHGFSHIRTPEDFQNAVPITTYEDYHPYIKRMVENGEQHLITDRRINMFATSSGTSGVPKLIPIVREMATIYFGVTLILADHLYEAMKRRGVTRRYGKGLLLTEMNGNLNLGESSEKASGTEIGAMTGFSIEPIKLIIPLFAAIPGEVLGNPEVRNLKYIKALYALRDPQLVYIGGILMSSLSDMMGFISENHEMLIRDIENGTINESAGLPDGIRKKLEKKLRPDPVRAAELREIFSSPDDGPLLNRIWKDMSLVASIGLGDFKPFTDIMRSISDKKTYFDFLAYGASEAVFGQAIELEDTRYLIFPHGGFYEFIPVDGKSDRPLLMHELEEGRYYEIVLTNTSGFYRYNIKDVVRVVGFEGEVPYIEFAYRANVITDICGIHLTGEELGNVVEKFGKDSGILITDYALYPNTDMNPPRLELFFETNDGIDPGADLSAVLEEALRDITWIYGSYRDRKTLSPAAAIPVRRGTFLEYREKRFREGASENQLKALRSIGSRELYDYFSKKTETTNGRNKKDAEI